MTGVETGRRDLLECVRVCLGVHKQRGEREGKYCGCQVPQTMRITLQLDDSGCTPVNPAILLQPYTSLSLS